MAVELTDEDLEFLLDLVNTEGEVRDSSGLGNNLANPSWGAADQPFIRITAPSYADGISAPRETVNTPREISDILVNQDTNGDGVEESIPNQFGGNAFLTFFGQYFDHGLDFVGKSGSVPIGSDSFPMNSQRANIMPGTGNADGIAGTADDIPAEHINKTSPFVDQNQAYGSHEAVTDLLRRWEAGENGQRVQTAYLLTGDADATGRGLLPTLNHIRENYRIMTGGEELTAADISNFDGTGQALLIDFIPAFTPTGQLDLDAIGHYYVAGDGRANENVMLTSIHTIWARNHNFWVDELKAKTGGAWTEEQYFQAARVINVAEYQRVVFTEFADAMAGGLNGGGTHGFGGYDTEINAAISAEFAHVAYRFGHSMLNETVSYVDGATGELADVSLVQAFLSPQNVAQLGVGNLIQGATAVEHQAIDIHVVNALRNQLVGRPLDLAALNIFRGRDTGVGTLNQVRTELFARTGDSSLRPYEGWEDFQNRNNLSDALIDKLKAAYPEGFEAVDLWIGGLLERAREGQLGSTFAWIFLDQLDRLQEGDRFYYLEQLDDADFRDQINNQSFSDIVARNTGLTNLPDNIFEATPLSSTPPVDPPAPEPGQPGEGPDIVMGGDGNDEIFGLGGNDELSGGAGNDLIEGGAGNDLLNGDAGSDELHGGAGRDELHGGAGNDELHGDGGNDELFGEEGNDALQGGAGNDLLEGGAGNDELEGGAGNDTLDGGAGNDLAIFSDIRANYQVTTGEDGVTTVTHLNGGADGIDTLTDIEELQFADEVIDTPPSNEEPSEEEPPAEEEPPVEEPPVNTAPTATAIGQQMAAPGVPFSLNTASRFADPDAGDALTYSMTGPSWLSINSQTGVITGTPPVHTVMQELAANAHGNYAVPSGGGVIEISTRFFANSASYNNSFGYYVADASGKAIGGAIIENSARAIGLDRTTTVDLDDYPGAASVGFFIIPNGAKNRGLSDGDSVEFKQVKGSWGTYIDGKKICGEGSGIYFSNPALNADKFDHMKDTLASGNQNWEDLRGGGDKNFNDVNVQVSVKAPQTVPNTGGGQVVVTATDKGGLTAQTGFAIGVVPQAVIAAALAGAIRIQDETPTDGVLTAAENQPLSALLQPLFDAGTIAEIRYQWQSSSNGGQSWSAIPGATSMRYTPRQSDLGLSLRVALIYIFADSAFAPQTIYSEATPQVAAADNGNNDPAPEQPGNVGGGGGQDTAEGGEGDDTVDNTPPAQGGGGQDDPSPEPPAGANVIQGSGAGNFLFGTPGMDVIFAKAGNDVVHGGSGGDFIYGGEGNDLLFGGDGDDMLFGEAGDDLLFGGDGDDGLDGGEGDDKLFGGEGEDVLDGGAGEDELSGGQGDDSLDGGAGDDVLHGGAGADLLSGGTGSDVLSAGAGDDILSGGAGQDLLSGGAGDDILDGGAGDDILFGGAGHDIFIYRSGGGNDSIMDFEEEADAIQLEGDDLAYTVNATDYGQDYVFQNGSVLKVHGNSGKGSNNSGSGNSGSGNSGSGKSGSGKNRSDDDDDDFDLGGSNGSGSFAAEICDDDWSELILSGVVGDPLDTPLADCAPPLADLCADPGLTALGFSTLPFSHEDTNLIC